MADTTNKPVVFLAFANDRDDTIGYLRNLPDEARRLRDVLQPAEQAGLCEVVVRSNSTAADIFKVFQDPRYRNRVAILHYGGHANGYELLLESAAGQAATADAGGLLTYRAGKEHVAGWNLPNAVDDPLFGLPTLPERELPESPYRHLSRFAREDADVFFGRGHQIRELYDRPTAPSSSMRPGPIWRTTNTPSKTRTRLSVGSTIVARSLSLKPSIFKTCRCTSNSFAVIGFRFSPNSPYDLLNSAAMLTMTTPFKPPLFAPHTTRHRQKPWGFQICNSVSSTRCSTKQTRF